MLRPSTDCAAKINTFFAPRKCFADFFQILSGHCFLVRLVRNADEPTLHH